MIDHGQALKAGTTLHEFKIERLLGEGGFGLTYLAFDESLQKHVAIKEYLPIDFAIRSEGSTVIPRTESSRGDFDWGLNAFLDEARVLARFNHPNIVRVNRFFQENGTAYIVMEYVDGRTLGELVRELQQLTEREILAILSPLIDGLKHVHQQSVYHRDIKPDNIIIRDNGSPVLIDFGAARQSIGSKSRSITTIVTPGYAPIEQYSSKGKLGPWTDIYALAAVSYTCLTGHRPDDASDRVVDDELIPATQAAAMQATAGFLSAVDVALAIPAKKRPQTLDDWMQLLVQKSAQEPPKPEPKAEQAKAAPERDKPAAESHTNKATDHRLNETTQAGEVALRQLKLAAEEGNADAQYKLGTWYQHGLADLAKDNHEAASWYRKAASQGHEKATQALQELPTHQSAGAAVRAGLAESSSQQEDQVDETVTTEKKGMSFGLVLGWLCAAIVIVIVGSTAKDAYDAQIEEAELQLERALEAEEQLAQEQFELEQGYEQDQRREQEQTRESDDNSAYLQQQLQAQIANCKAHFDADRLTVGSSGNAKDCYRQILEEHPYNEAALAGLQAIENRYSELFEVALSESNFDKARRYVEKIAVVNADSPLIESFTRRIESSEQLLASQQQDNQAEALTLYLAKAQQGDADAQLNLASAYDYGTRGLEVDEEEAVRWYRKSALQGNSTAQNNLAYAYQTGEGIAQDYTEAAKWYRKAAEQGNDTAQNNLANAYDSGEGVVQDYTEAAKWYRKSADQGNEMAQNNLGYAYWAGQGVSQNFVEAAEWFRKGAENGHAMSQNNLGNAYSRGEGVEDDQQQAIKWFKKAAQQGNSSAQETLEGLGETW